MAGFQLIDLVAGRLHAAAAALVKNGASPQKISMPFSRRKSFSELRHIETISTIQTELMLSYAHNTKCIQLP